jgi:hypothetical protein
MREPRLGDDIDDFCVRCKRIMNHAVVSVVNNEPAKVRCRTCHSDHDFRHEQPPPPKVDLRKQALFTEVLKKVSPADAATAGDIDPELVVEADEALEADGVDGDGAEAEAEIEAIVEPDPPAEEPKPKAKAKAKTTRKK